jgi:hypothetical protein
MNKKVMCVVVHGVYKPWTDITEIGQELTWLSLDRNPRVSVYHAYGKPVRILGKKFDTLHEKIRFAGRWPHLFLNIFDWIISVPFLAFVPRSRESKLLSNHDHQIQIAFPDIYLTHRWKELSILRHFVNETDFDFIYMTTSSSYLRLNQLLAVADSFNEEVIYAGSIPNVSGRFASGANRLISRKAASTILRHRLRWSPRWLGDYGLGRLCEGLGIYCHELRTLNIDSIEGVNMLSLDQIAQNHHFRLKSGDLRKRNDIDIMNRLHARVLKESL